ncbi:haloacid dehalogenase-like hydrolase [Lentilactobacillus senioris DSM 24302 = JCM 17472]|uniref:Haloacid dehalogenase-like hydrolase n=1 Tax=Lentilactobacillus senioris DSM 24302 = JCM 17472 TaxID=1423802 RepID=A0A0R2D177_9LACO|nr:HAD-IA family hydrolase [Lentilactobacillus senioris]KRM93772.1 haloacid dehalogenase-like hydrolase [Lentilactobacillus senioris DSM 24302 = JCM 17472]
MINQLFWDFDGTLFDTYPAMVRAFHLTLMDLNVDEVEIDDHSIYTTMRQQSLGTAFDQYGAEFGLNLDQLKITYYRHEVQEVAGAKPIAGVAEILQQAIDNGGANYLLTHRNDQAKQLLADNGFKNQFVDAVTADMPFPRKPKPDSLNYLIDKHNVDRKAAMMIGDRELDVLAGHNANIASSLFDPDGLIVQTGDPEIRVAAMPELKLWLAKS